MHTEEQLSGGILEQRLNWRKLSLRPNSNIQITRESAEKADPEMYIRVSTQMAPKLRTRGALVRRILPPRQKAKENERKKDQGLPHICQDKQKRRGGGWWVVNL